MELACDNCLRCCMIGDCRWGQQLLRLNGIDRLRKTAQPESKPRYDAVAVIDGAARQQEPKVSKGEKISEKMKAYWADVHAGKKAGPGNRQWSAERREKYNQTIKARRERPPDKR